MADYKVIDAEKLDADLTTVADAIRAKGGTTEKLEFPLGMKSAVEAIQTGVTKPEQEKTISITENGTTEVTPDEGKVLSKVTVNVEVESGVGGGIDLIEYKFTNGSYEYENENLTEIPLKGFHYDSYLTKCSFPNVIEIGTDAFYYCEKLTEINVPSAKKIYQQCFGQTKITSIYLPLVEQIPMDCFNYCTELEKIDIGVANRLNAYCFNRCNSLKALILRTETVVALINVNAFNYCFHYHGTTDSKYNPSGLKDGYVYVPRNLITSYQTATNWSTLYASHTDMFRALEDYYTVDGSITGALDESKI